MSGLEWKQLKELWTMLQRCFWRIESALMRWKWFELEKRIDIFIAESLHRILWKIEIKFHANFVQNIFEFFTEKKPWVFWKVWKFDGNSVINPKANKIHRNKYHGNYFRWKRLENGTCWLIFYYFYRSFQKFLRYCRCEKHHRRYR